MYINNKYTELQETGNWRSALTDRNSQKREANFVFIAELLLAITANLKMKT